MPRNAVAAALLLAVLGLAPATATADVDHGDPVAVLQAVIDAARSRDFAPLAALCDPKAENDADTRRICALATNAAGADDFVSYFGSGRVTGPAAVEGDRARVPFVFGPDGTRAETMVLVNRDGKWYLLGF